MNALEMKSWKYGLNAISLTLVLRQHSGLSLSKAKAEVERLIDGESVKIDFPSPELRDEFRRMAEDLGAVCAD